MILEKCTFFFSPALYSLLTHQSPGLLVNMNFPVFAVLMSHIQDPLSPKVQIFQTIKSRRVVKRPRAALKYPRGVLQREMCRNLKRCPPPCHHTCEITCQIYFDFKDLLLPASPSLKLFNRGNT